MIEMVIHKGVNLINLPEELKAKVRKDMSFTNPAYTNAIRYGGFFGSNLPKTLEFYSENKKNGTMYIPKGYFYFFLKHVKKLEITYKIEDRTTVFPKMDLKFYGDPREYQTLAINDVKKYPIGVLESGTGSGKTWMGIKMIEVRKQPTLIVVHSKELLKQWRKSIQDLLHYEVGEVGDGKFNIKDITVGIVKSIQNNIDAVKDRFGFVIIDETHRCPSSTFVDVLSQMSCKYQLGLSATAYRSDKLDHVIFAFIGPKIHKVDRENLNKIGAVLVPELRRVNSDFLYFYDGVYSKMVSTLVLNEDRNNLIVKNVCLDLRETSSAILIVSDRVNHCEILQEKLRLKGIDSLVLVAETNREERKSIVDSIRDGSGKILIATTQLIGEGFDAPNLGSLHLTTPIKFRGKLIQVIGRILRPNKSSRKPVIFDYRDPGIKTLRNISKERDKAYKTEWGI